MLIDPYRYAGSLTDPFFSDVVALIHMDGADGGTTFTDHSSYGRAIGQTGSPTTVTATKQYGTAALALPGDNNSLVSMADAAELKLASTDFTIEFWAYRATSGASLEIHKNAFTSVYPCKINIAGSGALGVSGADGVGAAAYSLTGLATFPSAAWTHVAVVRSGNDFYLFQDGVQQDTDTYSGALGTNTATWRIGPVGSSTFHVDDFRMTLAARYTTGFTPPTAAFPNS